MGTQNDIIELNGYRYDARTGARLGRSGTSTEGPKPRSIDGFGSRPALRNISPKQPTPSTVVHQKVNKSTTLRRQGLQKPVIASKDNNQSAPIAKRSLQPDFARVSRAQEAAKSPHVAKFQATTSSKPMEIKSAPIEEEITKPEPQEINRSVLPLSQFDMALQGAQSHEQKLPKQSIISKISKSLRVNTRALSMGLALFVVLSTGILFARQNMSTLAVRLAATRAGVEAKLPGYKPAGFSLSGPVEYSAGQIALSYSSSTDDRNFTITQKKSEWNSQALLDNFVQALDKPFQTVQDKGKTIYLFNGTNATWVSGGVWYQVEGESSLSSDQLLRIASSL